MNLYNNGQNALNQPYTETIGLWQNQQLIFVNITSCTLQIRIDLIHPLFHTEINKMSYIAQGIFPLD